MLYLPAVPKDKLAWDSFASWLLPAWLPHQEIVRLSVRNRSFACASLSCFCFEGMSATSVLLVLARLPCFPAVRHVSATGRSVGI